MRLRWMAVCVGLLMLICGIPALAQDVPSFEQADCMFPVPAGQTVECGYLSVPEDRSKPNSQTIRLAVATFKSKSANPAPDPLVYLEGGPGGHSLSLSGLSFNQLLAPFAEDRDVILFDQRGVGFSEPVLNCSEFTQLTRDLLEADEPAQEELTQSFDAVKSCAARLENQGINLDAYNSASNAADVNDLRLALGYDQVNLFGTSYGTRLALTVMRDFPEGVRSVILGAVYPLQVNLFADTMANTDRVLNKLFEGCNADAACAAAYPDLEATFYKLIADWNANPVTVGILDPFAAERFDALINGDELISALFTALYSTDLIPTLPKLIYEARDGNFESLSTYLSLPLATNAYVSRGMYLSVECHDEGPFTDANTLQNDINNFPQFSSYIERSGDPVELCNLWPSGKGAAIENEAVVSDIPTLLLVGEYDPVTPPEWGKLVADSLSNSFFYEVTGMGHDASLQECPIVVGRSFLSNPTQKPDDACLSQLKPPAFVIAGQEVAATVTLKDYQGAGFTTVVPDGWQELMSGTFARGASPTDQTALVIMALPVPGQAYLQGMAAQLGLDSIPESSGTREANGITWTLYDVELLGFPSKIAIAEQGGTTYLIQFIAVGSEIDALTESVFYPVIDSFEIGG